MKKITLSFIAAICCAFTLAAGEMKIAVIDMGRVFKAYYKTEIAHAKYKEQQDAFKSWAQQLRNSHAKLRKSFEKLRDESLTIAINEKERVRRRALAQEKYRQLKAKEEELRKYEQEKSRLLQQKYIELRTKLLNEIKAVVAKRAAAAGYTLVFDKSGLSLNELSTVVYHKKELDISDDIIKELNRDVKK